MATYPHDVESYTQGLLYAGGHLYESSGKYGQSRVQRTELATGTVTTLQPLEDEYFGEGLAKHGDRLYQLTWKAGRGFVYRLGTLEPIGGFRYDGQGWGLTSDGRQLYMSDGSAFISIRDPRDFSESHRFRVHDDDRDVTHLNELEFVNGHIWANIYRSPTIVMIDPTSGRVSARLDLSQLVDAQDDRADVLNGIAHDPDSDRIFVTGKFWPTLYELRLLGSKDGTKASTASSTAH